MDSRTQAARSALNRARPTARVGDPSAESRLIKGDNLAVLASLLPSFAGRFRCVYVDPPFNTGRAFREYDDARTPAEWREFMRERLLAILPLLAPDGALFLEIDDKELGTALELGDAIFGRAARVSTITLVRSASTGHKAKNRGPVNVTDFILVYERQAGAWRCHPQRRERRGYDPAYRTVLLNPGEPDRAWRFESLARVVARERGHATVALAKRALGAVPFQEACEAFALARSHQVVRFAQPRYDAISRVAQRAVLKSRATPARIVRLARPGFPDLVLSGGNRVLFLADKVVVTAKGPRLVEPLTNVWDDIPFQGIAREGGVVFRRNKKPERLLERILALATDEGDWVLDPFLGSGTTAAVAEKMGRRWVGIEQGATFADLALPRLERVVRGEDATGISKARNHHGGGGFLVFA